MNHTHGPWIGRNRILRQVEIPIRAVDQESLGFSIIYVNTSDPARTAEARANASLIGAAPELLQCLKTAIQIIGHPDSEMTKLFCAIVEKAEGK